jgi:hypothetical protein
MEAVDQVRRPGEGFADHRGLHRSIVAGSREGNQDAAVVAAAGEEEGGRLIAVDHVAGVEVVARVDGVVDASDKLVVSDDGGNGELDEALQLFVSIRRVDGREVLLQSQRRAL